MRFRSVCLALAVTALALLGCKEVHSDYIIGDPAHGTHVVQRVDAESSKVTADTLTWDDAEYLEGVWTGIPASSEDNAILYLKHTAPARLEVAWVAWGDDRFRIASTTAILSNLGSGDYINLHLYDERIEDVVDTTSYWIARYRLHDELLLVYPADYYSLVEEVDSASVDEDVLRIRSKSELDSLVQEKGWDMWDENPIALQRLTNIPDD